MLARMLARWLEFWQREPLLVSLDLLDIGLVAFLIYRILCLMRGTRAMQTGTGLAMVFVVHYLARKVGLTTLWNVLDGLLTYIVLIVVIIFQDDIRRALTRVGHAPWLGRRNRSVTRHMVEEIVRAVGSLMTRRIGAIIVLERNASLHKFVESGVRLDAALSRELLYSIFVPSYQNPMHDGAVVLREGRIWQAGVVLPLTSSEGLDRDLGTRHRAAIGITEESDAVAVVVSEERGSVSVCAAGQIRRDLDLQTFKQVLLDTLDPKADEVLGEETLAEERSSVTIDPKLEESLREEHVEPLPGEKTVKTTPMDLSFTDESVPVTHKEHANRDHANKDPANRDTPSTKAPARSLPDPLSPSPDGRPVSERPTTAVHMRSNRPRDTPLVTDQAREGELPSITTHGKNQSSRLGSGT